MHNLPSPFKTACEDKHLAGFKKYTKSACLLKCRADYVISMCKCRSYDLEGKASICIRQMNSAEPKPRVKTFMNKSNYHMLKYHSVHLLSTTKYTALNLLPFFFFSVAVFTKKQAVHWNEKGGK